MSSCIAAPQTLASPPCLVVNPKSFRASRGGLAARAVQLASAYGAEVIEATSPAQLIAGLKPVLARDQRRLFVLSGDGTVHALVEHLAALPATTPRPQLLVLGGGRSNLTAADLGGNGAVLEKLEAALKRCRDGQAFVMEERHTLVIEQTPAPLRRGFFVAGGAIDSGVRAAHQHRDSGRGAIRKGPASTGWYLLKLALLTLFGRGPISCPTLEIDAADCGSLRGPSRALIATTLLHRRGWFNPYANRGNGALRITAIARSAPRFWRSLPFILMGRFGSRLTLEHGYLSGRCAQIEVLGLSGYSLDGEAFDTDPTRPVLIRSGAPMAFLTL